MKQHLTEEELKCKLNLIIPNSNFIHNRKIKESNIRSRPDFHCPIIKTLIEFDGYYHYNNTKTILRDCRNIKEYERLGYKIIRIPYFVQLDDKICKLLFGVEMDLSNEYPHGFISDKALLPSDFNELGIERFQEDLKKFSIIKEYIVKSLKDKIEISSKEMVLPKKLYYLVE